MGVKNKLKGLAINAFLSEPARRARGRIHDVRRRVKGDERCVELYYQADDPYSHLLAQAVERLAGKYSVGWQFHVVPGPAQEVDPAPKLRRLFAARDARELTTFYDLELPDGPDEIDSVPLTRANQVLVKKRPFDEQLRAALEVGEALWSKDTARLTAAQGTYAFEASGKIAPITQLNYARMRKLGHYCGGTLYYAGEWYWGIDRLPHLEARLAQEEGVELESVLSRRPDDVRPPERLADGDERLRLELFFSFRSPYSYLAVDRAVELAARYPIDLDIRPVLPMVMRGLEVPAAKRMYIAKDAKREADRLGIPFGRICDPLGKGVERCLAIFGRAKQLGREVEFVRSAARGIWSEALDPASYNDMRKIVTRAELDWDDVADAVKTDDWRSWVDENAEALFAAGLWGVPTFAIGNYATWGQDRVELVEDRIRRHLAATGGTHS